MINVAYVTRLIRINDPASEGDFVMYLTESQKLMLLTCLRDSLNLNSSIFGQTLEDRLKLFNLIINQQDEQKSGWVPCIEDINPGQ